MGKRIVITGLGFFTGRSYDKETLWEQIKESHVLPGKYEKIVNKEISSTCAFDMAGNVNVDDHIENKKLRRLADFSKMLCVAARTALEDAGISKDSSDYVAENVGSIVNTVHGPMNVTFDYLDDLLVTGPQTARPFLFQQTVNNVACGQVAIENQLKGVSSTIVGASSIDYAVSLLRKDLADACLVAGVEELHPYIYAAHGMTGMLATDKGEGEHSIPFSEKANGLVLGEGAGVLVVETYESAKRRNAHIYAEILESTVVTDEMFCKRYDDFKLGLSTGFERAMRKTLEKSNVLAEEIGFISLAANSYPLVDQIERNAIQCVMGNEDKIGYVASKAIFGETMGASEVLGTVVALVCMEHNTVPGLSYLNNECYGTENTELCLVNSLFTGGNINSLLLKKYVESC